MKLLILCLSILSMAISASPLKVDVFKHDLYCQYDHESESVYIWDEETGNWGETPSITFSVENARSQDFLGETTSVVFPGGAADTLFFGYLTNGSGDYVDVFTTFTSNTDARSFKEIITENTSDYFLVYLDTCGTTLVANLSSGEVASAVHFLK